MRSSVVLSSALVAAFALAGLASAQQPPGGFGGGGFRAGGFGGGLAIMLRTSKPVQDELKMDKDQIDKLTEAELVDLNNLIVARLRFLREMRAHAAM